jgi:NAD+--asparagine ADP-ribosyltransferase
VTDHNITERKLKTDIHFKNALRKDLVESVQQLHSWQEKIHSLNNIRKTKKLQQTVRRYADFVEDLRAFLSPLLDELESRITTEMKFSKDEIKQFTDEVKEETMLAAKARDAFTRAKEALGDVEEKTKIDREELDRLKQDYRAAFRAFRLEKHKLIEAEEELQSELVDKEIFKLELKRILVERHFISEI